MEQFNQHSYNDLLQGFLNENTRDENFTLIVKAFQQRLYFFIRRMVVHHDDANDVLQEVFIKAWRKLHQLKDAELMNAWFYRIAHNESINHLNSLKRNSPVALNDSTHLSITDDDFKIDADEWTKKISRAILQLPTQQRVVFNLRYFDEMPYNEISEVMEISVGGAKSLFHHALQKMQAMLEIEKEK